MRFTSIRILVIVSCLTIGACGEAGNIEGRHSPFDRFDERPPRIAESPVTSLEEGQSTTEIADKRAWKADEQISSQAIVRTKIQRCGEVRYTCVVDGDTLWLKGAKIRLADIDTPEISRPKCQREAQLGQKATDRLIQLLNAGPLTMAAIDGPDEDRYGRKLRIFLRDGQSIGLQLVQEGLAHEWNGRRLTWC